MRTGSGGSARAARARAPATVRRPSGTKPECGSAPRGGSEVVPGGTKLYGALEPPAGRDMGRGGARLEYGLALPADKEVGPGGTTEGSRRQAHAAWAQPPVPRANGGGAPEGAREPWSTLRRSTPGSSRPGSKSCFPRHLRGGNHDADRIRWQRPRGAGSRTGYHPASLRDEAGMRLGTAWRLGGGSRRNEAGWRLGTAGRQGHGPRGDEAGMGPGTVGRHGRRSRRDQGR